MTFRSAQSRTRRPFTPFSIVPFGMSFTILVLPLPLSAVCFFRYLLRSRTRYIRRLYISVYRNLPGPHEISCSYVDVSDVADAYIVFDDLLYHARSRVPPDIHHKKSLIENHLRCHTYNNYHVIYLPEVQWFHNSWPIGISWRGFAYSADRTLTTCSNLWNTTVSLFLEK